MTISELRDEARRLFDQAIAAADPAAALCRRFAHNPIEAPAGKLLVIAVGKAATPMMRETLGHIPPGASVEAVVITNPENAQPVEGARVHAAGHPVPNAAGAKAAQDVIETLDAAGPSDRVIALISGGGSALLPAPVQGVSLDDKARVSEILLGAGFDITQMNLVRQQLSRLKGGGFLALASPAPVEAFILSDVVGDDLRVIASGPTVAPIGTRSEARHLLETHGLLAEMPSSVQAHLRQPDQAATRRAATNHLICSNRQSLEAMLAAAGTGARIVDDRLEGNVADVAPALVARAAAQSGPVALIWGGETTVTLTGTGRGGRNQDLALRVALLARDLPGDWVFLSGGTDGRDGPTDAAGGLVDPGSIERMRAAGLDPEALLANNDAYTALTASGDLIVTGGTGTNVADVQVFLRA